MSLLNHLGYMNKWVSYWNQQRFAILHSWEIWRNHLWKTNRKWNSINLSG